ncbi:EXS-domain-containing protein [Aspergillus steynii IBT 23096]|uniref:EXS-domain-containing protein n=1 Tax=Aspergillus steynii IBT 23096 TaxID=1392250 RepID=A0A2I2FZ98_9EURO|nr:EXS-domain-containing protein [Aspergillus steynii IBT 23096]PLB45945.1 EXS-domain-containing protein [Aspergillus steynii IBT 23096]
MKFAKELEQELVPEWRAKYLDYKAGKKKLKAISRAIQKSNRNPSHPSLRRVISGPDDASFASPSGRDRTPSDRRPDATDSINNPSTPARSGALTSRSIPTPRARNERQPLRNAGSRFSAAVGSYGSIIATPPHQPASSDVASLELPDPALDPKEHEFMPDGDDHHLHVPQSPSPVMSRNASTRTVPADVSNASPLARQSTSGKGYRRNTVSSPSAKRTSQLLKRVFSHPDWDSPEKRAQETQQLSEIEHRQDEFFAFLDGEFSKIESFYQMKEEEATQRLHVLRQQLHIMRDQRIQEVLGTKSSRVPDGDSAPSNGFGGFSGSRLKDAFTGRRIGKNSKALAEMATPGLQAQDQNVSQSRRDFSRRPDDLSNMEVPYRVAKRKLKYALQEFYRGIELLKAYAYLNRTAFRKINKKYDKVANARPTMRYMSEKVNKAWFVQSEVIENLMSATEDLYARYFERGNRKLAASKLRHTVSKFGDYSSNTFLSGILLMAGILFAIQSLVYAAQHLRHSDPEVQAHTSYLMQLPCFFMFILGLFMWLNFLSVNAMYVYWPVVLVAITVIVLFLPARVLYHRSRKWWAYSNWRLALAGFYPVEFRDFFLGDMYCSQTYAMGNIALFFCLYAKHWSNAPQCNSSHSRLLGFFTCIPSILRALQCLRRYADTKNVFPHLLNFGKYMFGVLYYATLSMYRIDKVTRFEAPFITFALLNAVYTSVWDLAMDWSLGNPYARNPLLRDALAFRKAWVYYAAMAIDVIVRFNWIFYAIFAHDIQHSAVLSFAVSFSEICRRGVWTIFRVENEHCTNVLLFRASRDVPLPYEVASPQAEADHTAELQLHEPETATAQSAPADVEHGTPSTPGASMRARGMSRVGTILASAHAQDFERRKRPDQMAVASVSHGPGESPDDSSDDDDYPGDSRPYTDANDVIDEEGPSRGSPRTSSDRD